MVNDNLKNLYTQVFNKLKLSPQIQGVKRSQRGLLYKTIQIILKEEQSETEEKTLEICNRLGITSNADEDEDNKIISELIHAVWIDRQVVANVIPGKDIISNFLNNVSMNINQKNEVNKMEWIVITACALVGVNFCIKYLNEGKEREREREKNKRQPEVITPKSSDPIPVDLCLVVPASIARNFRNNQNLRVNELTHLIDNASYLLCTNADPNEKNLELTDEDIATVSEQREVYIRVNIADGEKMIGNKVPYILKGNLPSNEQGTVKNLACIKYLSVSGLEKFNRI
jgi:hypothetical protein